MNREALQAWLSARRGDAVAITELTRLATGNSRANWAVRMADGSAYVTRVEQHGVFGTSGAEEFTLMRAAHRLGCPVAEVRWAEPTGAVIGQPFFVMDFVSGVPSGRDDRSMSDELVEDFVTQLDHLHRTPWAAELGADPAHAVGVDDAVHRQIEHWHTVARAEVASPIALVEEGAAWLHRYAPTPSRVGIVHGDPGPGNLVHDGHRVLAFTDWEFAHLGDPTEDWVYLITMRGVRTRTAAQWTELFERLAGVRLTAADLRYWSAFNYFKGACANLTCRRVFASTPSPNLGIIGTALHLHYLRQLAEITGRPN